MRARPHGQGHSRHHRSSSFGCRKHSCLLSLESPTPRQTTRDGTPQGYFHGDIDARQFARRVRESGDYGFTGGAEFYALVTGAFQRAADAQLAHHSHTKEVESKLLRSLAALKAEFGLPDCYRIEPWRIVVGRSHAMFVIGDECRLCCLAATDCEQLINIRKTQSR
jgi:hypothetical protein